MGAHDMNMHSRGTVERYVRTRLPAAPQRTIVTFRNKYVIAAVIIGFTYMKSTLSLAATEIPCLQRP